MYPDLVLHFHLEVFLALTSLMPEPDIGNLVQNYPWLCNFSAISHLNWNSILIVILK
jgi:hypothetical protein